MKGVIAYAATCLGLFALIGFAIYWSNTLWPLIGLVFLPSYSSKDNDKID